MVSELDQVVDARVGSACNICHSAAIGRVRVSVPPQIVRSVSAQCRYGLCAIPLEEAKVDLISGVDLPRSLRSIECRRRVQRVRRTRRSGGRSGRPRYVGHLPLAGGQLASLASTGSCGVGAKAVKISIHRASACSKSSRDRKPGILHLVPQ